ncbi:hypothetical protein KY305_19745, partial [Bacillus sp. YC2]|nr:hypothetical protein [Bacillus sp. YC2]
KEEAKEREIKDLKKKLADDVTDPDEYLEIAKKIGYENLESDQQQYVLQLEISQKEADILKGIGTAFYDFGKDTIIGLKELVANGPEMINSVYKFLNSSPAQKLTAVTSTGINIWVALSDSWERDMVNGDTESRSHWIAYSVATVATMLIGTKGIDKVGKLGTVTAKSALIEGNAGISNVTKNITESVLNPSLNKVALESEMYQIRQLHNTLNTSPLKQLADNQSARIVKKSTDKQKNGLSKVEDKSVYKINPNYTTKIDSKVEILDKKELPSWIEESFLDGHYRTVKTKEKIIVYRTFGAQANRKGGFAATTPSESRIQSKIDSALKPEWKNSREFEAVIEIPKGTILDIGKVAPQKTATGTILEGKGDQILLPMDWPDEWIKETRKVRSR